MRTIAVQCGTELLVVATHSLLGFFAGATVASAIPSAVFPWRCCADSVLAAALKPHPTDRRLWGKG